MQINVQTLKGSLSDSTKDKIVAKIVKLARFVDRVAGIEAIVNCETQDVFRVEVVVTTELKKDFRADCSSGDLLGCVDQAVEKIEQQMRKLKEKLTEHHAKDARKG